ncbi:MAG: hypothetical protein ACXVAY_12805 [Mucilaginibacter sp.]
MSEVEQEVKVKKAVKEPRISLTMISRYIVASERVKLSILKKCKYPSNYIPKFYEMARKLVCEIFEGNFVDGHELYFEVFKQQAETYRKEAKAYAENRDDYKNRIYSAKGLDAIIAMSYLLTPILQRHTLENNLHRRRNKIVKNDVSIGAVSDMLLLDQSGVKQVGFLKFNFESNKLKREEAEAKLFVLKNFYEQKGLKLDTKSCILVDVIAWRTYSVADVADAETQINQATLTIRDSWDLI